MGERYINDKIAYIYEQFLEILLMQIRSLYEEYNEIYLDEFELKYRNYYKELINKKLKEKNLDKKIEEFILLESDPYGLDTRENDIKFIIGDIFREISIELSVESMLIKDKWKKEQIGSFTSEIKMLNELIEKDKKEINNISKQLETAENNLKKTIKQNNEEIIIYNNKLKQSDIQIVKLNKEKETLENKVNSLELSIRMIKNKINNTHNDEQIEEINNLKKEKEHLKRGIDVLRKTNKDQENKLLDVINEKTKIESKNKEILDIVEKKDKQIKKLQQELQNLSYINNNPKLTIEEIKAEYDEIQKKLFEQLKEIVSVFSTKIIGGQKIMTTVSNINKFSKEIKYTNDTLVFKRSLDELNLKLSQLNDLFNEDNKDSGLIPHIKNINELKSKIR